MSELPQSGVVTRTRVAVLGGGVGALTTAFELTSTPELRARYDVTLYQLGWRLGGKGASGRNREIANRIEEHGLHIWMGLYENAFKVMRETYRELGREPRPDDEAVARRVARRDAEAERKFAKDAALGAQDGGRGKTGEGGPGEEVAAVEHGWAP